MKLQAINVWQWDSFILERLYWKNDLVIDTWWWKVNFAIHLDKLKTYDLLLTHSHKDHIWGFQYIIQEKIKIENIYVPIVFNELYKIFYMIVNNWKKYLTKSQSSYLKEDKKTLDELGDWIGYINKNKINVIWVYHWYKETDTTFLNPFIDEKSLLTLFWIPKEFDLKVDERVEYTKWIIEWEFEWEELLISQNNNNYNFEQKTKIMEILLFWLQEKLNIFIEKQDVESYRELSKEFHKYPNKCSIVFQYNCNMETTILMTWDAEIDNFELIMKSALSEHLKSKILKVPHHGSKWALNKEVINFINPKISVISHDNRVFWWWESHPHCEVLENLLLLPENKIYMTNSITKPKKPCSFPCIKWTRIFFPWCWKKYIHKKVRINICNSKIDFNYNFYCKCFSPYF